MRDASCRRSMTGHVPARQQTPTKTSLIQTKTNMAPIFSGSLQSKKKTELVALASAFRLNDQGTKDELQTRIKKYMDKHQPDLEEDPAFAGLFGRRKRSVQPQPSIAG